jgi:hypothetical protein
VAKNKEWKIVKRRGIVVVKPHNCDLPGLAMYDKVGYDGEIRCPDCGDIWQASVTSPDEHGWAAWFNASRGEMREVRG